MQVFRSVVPGGSSGDSMSMAQILSAAESDSPLNASWVRVEPGGASHGHQHHDTELWFITGGAGVLRTEEGDSVRVEDLHTGDAVLLPPFTTHRVKNSSDTAPLEFLTVYWEDFAAVSAAANVARPDSRSPRTLVTAAPPTTNGDLHLGHLSGPYLGADILVRYLRLRGVDARFACGSDDHQSYVEALAKRTDTSPAEVSWQFSQAVRASLAAANAAPDVFVRSGVRPDHQRRVAEVLRRLIASGHAEARTLPALFCPSTGAYLYEAYVTGSCPHCGVATGGNACEECGLPNDPVDLIDPVCVRTGETPERRPLRRIVFPLEPFRDQIAEFVGRGQVPDRLRIIGERMLARPLPEIPLTHPATWGVAVGVEGLEEQRIWAWFDMWVNYVTQTHDLAEHGEWPALDELTGTAGELEVVQFFGCDNGYFHVVLYPALSYALYGRLPELRFVTNEFLLLDRRKFSTSRNHAIWGREALREWPADQVRLYLAYVRPEAGKTNFERADFLAFVQSELVGRWQRWLDHVGARVTSNFGGRVPVPGLWTGRQTRFFAEIGAMLRDVAECYEVAAFSPAAASRRLIEFVRRAEAFSEGDARWDPLSNARDTVRAGVALELAAARNLALASAPLMPGFAGRVWADLGGGDLFGQGKWTRQVEFVPPETAVSLSSDYFLARWPEAAASA